MGYKESEIVEAVIRAVSPSLKLRSYLEMIQDLPLSRLRQIMKAHFKQKSATELNQELCVLHQEASESPQDFLVRALNLKQQIIFVSNATDGSIKYEPSLVQALFLHVIQTGLQDEAIRAKLRPLLEVTSVTDKQLMEKVKIIGLCRQRQNTKIRWVWLAGKGRGLTKLKLLYLQATKPKQVLVKHPRVRVVSPSKRSQSQIHWLRHWKQCSQILPP